MPTNDRSNNRDATFKTNSSYIILDGLKSFNANRAAKLGGLATAMRVVRGGLAPLVCLGRFEAG
jgi:hypothetical protein